MWLSRMHSPINVSRGSAKRLVLELSYALFHPPCVRFPVLPTPASLYPPRLGPPIPIMFTFRRDFFLFAWDAMDERCAKNQPTT